MEKHIRIKLNTSVRVRHTVPLRYNPTSGALLTPIIMCLLLHIIPAVSLQSNPDLEFSGYVYEMPIYSSAYEVNLPDGDKAKTGDNILNLTRLRLKPTIEFDENSRLEIHYEIDLMYSMELLSGLSFGNKTSRQAVRLNWTPYAKGNFAINHFIDRLYYKNSFDWGDLVIGRQRISWGVGRVWQPTDMFGPINPANFSKFEKDGADAVSLKYTIGELSDIETVFNYVNNFAESNYGARFRTNFSEYDLSLMAGFFDEAPRIGLDFAGNFFGAGLRGEALYSVRTKKAEDYIRAIIGADYQISEEIYTMLEFHYNGQGTTCRYCYDFGALARGEVMNVGKFYGAVQMTYMFNQILQAAAMSIVNIGDGSGLISPSASYSVDDDLSLRLGGMIFFGKALDEYSYYSTSVYLLGEYYF